MKEFIEHKIYEDIPEGAHHGNCLFVPELDGDEYIRTLTLCILRLFAKVTHKAGNQKTDFNEEMAELMRRIGRFVGFLANCTSMDTGEFIKYDADELKKRLESIARCITPKQNEND